MQKKCIKSLEGKIKFNKKIQPPHFSRLSVPYIRISGNIVPKTFQIENKLEFCVLNKRVGIKHTQRLEHILLGL